MSFTPNLVTILPFSCRTFCLHCSKYTSCPVLCQVFIISHLLIILKQNIFCVENKLCEKCKLFSHEVSFIVVVGSSLLPAEKYYDCQDAGENNRCGKQQDA